MLYGSSARRARASRQASGDRLRRAGISAGLPTRRASRPLMDPPAIIGSSSDQPPDDSFRASAFPTAGEARMPLSPWRDTGVAVEDRSSPTSTMPSPRAGRSPGSRCLPLNAPTRTIQEAGTVPVRVICNRPGVFRTYRLDQFIAAMAQRTLWITGAYFVATTSSRRRSRKPRGMGRRCGFSRRARLTCRRCSRSSGGLSVADRERHPGLRVERLHVSTPRRR